MRNQETRCSISGLSLAARERLFLLSTCATWAALLVVHGEPAKAQTNLITDPGFNIFAKTSGGTVVPTVSFGYGTASETSSAAYSLVGWASTGYNFAFLPQTLGVASSITAIGSGGKLSLWSQTTGSTTLANTFTNEYVNNGTTFNFIANDGDYSVGATTQTISGLTPGKQYTLSFAWAAAQQTGYSGTIAEDWTVSLGSQTFATPTITLASESFSGWSVSTFVFTASASSEVLSFLAYGSAQLPPFMLLADPTLTAQVPEPASITGLLSGIVGMLGLGRWRRGKAKGAKAAA